MIDRSKLMKAGGAASMLHERPAAPQGPAEPQPGWFDGTLPAEGTPEGGDAAEAHEAPPACEGRPATHFRIRLVAASRAADSTPSQQ